MARHTIKRTAAKGKSMAMPTRRRMIEPSHRGMLHRDLGVAPGRTIPASALAEALRSDDPAVRKRAQFAQNAKSWHH